MMSHVVERWLNRQEEWPDLLLIDGGLVHLNEIHSLLLEHELVDQVPLASLAKREETIHRINCDDLVLDRKGRVLVFARDEAHRFANTFNVELRLRKISESLLDEFPGIGSRRKATLLKHFGSLQRLREATAQQIAEIPGFGPKTAESLRVFLDARAGQ